jgi:endonuclease/exonuclease/phosphatase (EEP) superfamily protein YafD
VRHLLSDYVGSPTARLSRPSGETISFQELHRKPLLPDEGAGQRDAELLPGARALRDVGGPAVMGGALNAVASSDTSWLTQRIGGLLDPQVGRGQMPTFATWLPRPRRVPIDHLFVPAEFQLDALERLTDIGSDGLPLLVRLCHAPGGGGNP